MDKTRLKIFFFQFGIRYAAWERLNSGAHSYNAARLYLELLHMVMTDIVLTRHFQSSYAMF